MGYHNKSRGGHREFHRPRVHKPRLSKEEQLERNARDEAFDEKCRQAARIDDETDVTMVDEARLVEVEKYNTAAENVDSYLCNESEQHDAQNLLSLFCEVGRIREMRRRRQLLNKIVQYFTSLKREQVVFLLNGEENQTKYEIEAGVQKFVKVLLDAKNEYEYSKHLKRYNHGKDVFEAMSKVIVIISRLRHGFCRA